ncbi:hypothetical protein ACKFKF_29855 [Phormidesmis sp. 146-12]
MNNQSIQVGDPRSLRACQVRVVSLTKFLEHDWHQESAIWLMNSTLQLAEATAILAMKEVEAAAALGLPPQFHNQVSQVGRSSEAYRDRITALTRQLWQEQRTERRASLALELAEASATLARLIGADVTRSIAIG